MSVPLRSKLSYAWTRIAHADRMYSHVFESKFSDNMWLMAEPLKGGAKHYQMYECIYRKAQGDPRQGELLEGYYKVIPYGVYNSEQALQTINRGKSRCLELLGAYIRHKNSPSKASLKPYSHPNRLFLLPSATRRGGYRDC